jgi:phosphoribosyl-ATP pyrophosphohydrolase
MTFSLEELNQRVADRATASPDESYTARLLRDGVDRCARKFGEEAVELIVSAVSRDKQGLASEAADVIYHLLVLLKAGDVTLAEVMSELERRTGQSGLQEKASRTK